MIIPVKIILSENEHGRTYQIWKRMVIKGVVYEWPVLYQEFKLKKLEADYATSKR